jgi:hypothetical protein
VPPHLGLQKRGWQGFQGLSASILSGPRWGRITAVRRPRGGSGKKFFFVPAVFRKLFDNNGLHRTQMLLSDFLKTKGLQPSTTVVTLSIVDGRLVGRSIWLLLGLPESSEGGGLLRLFGGSSSRDLFLEY